MGFRRTLGAALAGAVCTSLTLTGGAARADSIGVLDSLGDVLSFGGGDVVTYTPAPDDTTTDVFTIQVNHAKKRFKLTLKMNDLLPSLDEGVFADLKTNKDRYNVVLARSVSGNTYVVSTVDGKVVRCAGKKKKFNATKDLIKISLPRKCLGNPRWIKAGALVTSFTENATYIDDALRDGLKKNGNLTFTPRLYRN